MRNYVKLFTALLFFAITFTPVLADWEVPETGTTGQVNAILKHDQAIFAGTSDGVFISINQGKQWIERDDDINNKNIQALVSIGNAVYAGSNGGGVLKTTNLGEKWESKNDGLGNPFIYGLAVEGDSLYAVTDESGVYMSKDRGETWFSLNNGDIIGIVLFSIAVHDGKVYVGGQFGNIYTTSDYGLTWENINKGDLFFNIKSIKFKGNQMLVGTSSGIFLSNDLGSTWKVINSGLKNTDISDVEFKDDLFYAATKGGGVYITNNDGASWIDVNEGIPGMNVTALAFDDKYVYAGFQFNSVSRRLLSEIKFPEVVPPVLSTPENAKQNVDPDITFTWKESKGAISYFLQVALSDDFSNPIYQKDNLKTTSIKQTLEKGLKYYWRVAANTPDSKRKWSEVWSFSTREDQTAPVLLSPQNEATGVPIPVTFIWSKSKGTESYNLQISADSTFENLIINKAITNDTTFVYDNLEENTQYYWIVYSIGYDENKLSNDKQSFTTGTHTAVFDHLDPDDGIISLYPNPVANELNMKINFNANDVRIILFSSNGKEIAGLFNGNLTEGSVLKFDNKINHLSSGVYFIGILANGKYIVQPFVKN